MQNWFVIKNDKLKAGIFIAIAVAIFTVLFLCGKIGYGDTVSIANSNEYYMNQERWEIKNDVNFTQTFTYNGNCLHSFTLKYAMDGSSVDSKWEVKLINAETTETVQTWIETGEQIDGQNLKEYILDKPYAESCKKFEISVKALAEGSSAVYLCGSGNNTLLVGELSIDDQVQEGDLSIMYSEIKNIRITLLYGAILALCLAGIICYFLFSSSFSNITKTIKNNVSNIWNEKNKILSYLILFMITSGLTRNIEVFWSGYNQLEYNWIRYLYWTIIIWILIVFYLQRKYLKTRPEIVVCTVLGLVGFLYIFAVPAEAEISWDESIHYWRTVSLSHANTGIANYAESYLYWHSGIPYGLPNTLSNLEAVYENIQSMYDQMRPIAINTDVLSELYIVSYIPAALFLKLGRGLHLPYWFIFKLGLLVNFSLYLILVYLAIKKIKSGKMIVTVAATAGSAFFLATVYSSDWWIFGWFMLAMSYFLSCMQSKEKIKKSEVRIIIIASLLACFPKVIYFPLLCLFFFMPREKFEDQKQYHKYLSVLIASIGLLAMGVVYDKIWILPLWFILYGIIYQVVKRMSRLNKKTLIIIFGALCLCLVVAALAVVKYVLPAILGTGDIRGGTDVNAAMQVKYILENPMQYVNTLFQFLVKGYFPFNISMGRIFNTLGYLGTTSCHWFSLVLLVVVSITDKATEDQWKRYNYVKWTVILLSFIIICLISTAMYVSFTPVGYGTIAGVQQRYVMPLLYIFFAMIGSCKFKNRMNKSLYNLIVIALCTAILLGNIWSVEISKYL